MNSKITHLISFIIFCPPSMLNLPTLISKRLSSTYSNCFSSPNTRQISNFINSRSTPPSILYHDYLYLDEDIEFLRRYYQFYQSKSRINLIVERFQSCNLFKNSPYLKDPKGNKIKEKNWKRKNKNREAVEELDQKKNNLSYSSYLREIGESELRSLIVAEPRSYQSSVFDIYEGERIDEKEEEIKTGVYIPINMEWKSTDNHNMDELKHLITDFDDVPKQQVVPKKQKNKILEKISMFKKGKQTKPKRFYKKQKTTKKDINTNAQTKNLFYSNQIIVPNFVTYSQYTRNQEHNDYLQILSKLTKKHKYHGEILDTRSRYYLTALLSPESFSELLQSRLLQTKIIESRKRMSRQSPKCITKSSSSHFVKD